MWGSWACAIKVFWESFIINLQSWCLVININVINVSYDTVCQLVEVKRDDVRGESGPPLYFWLPDSDAAAE